MKNQIISSAVNPSELAGPQEVSRGLLKSHLEEAKFTSQTMAEQTLEEIDEIQKKIIEFVAKRRILMSMNESKESEIAKLQANADEIRKRIREVRIDFESLAVDPWFRNKTILEDMELVFDNPYEREFQKEASCWIPMTPPKPIPARPEMQQGNATAPGNCKSKKRGFDGIDLSQNLLKRARRKMEYKSKATIIGGKPKKSPKPGSLKETCRRKANLTEKTDNPITSKPTTRSSKRLTTQKFPSIQCSQITTRSYKKVSVLKLKNDKQTQLMKQDQKARGRIQRKCNKSVPHVGSSDCTLRWHLQPQVDLSIGEADNNKEKEKWWEEERELFHERAKSFIASMNLVQGNKYFWMWRGSVVDSVVGAFLTQRVTDLFSSSAFMSLAAKYQSGRIEQTCDQIKSSRNGSNLEKHELSFGAKATTSRRNDKNVRNCVKEDDWDSLRNVYSGGTQRERSEDTMDSLDWEAVRQAPLTDISKSILGRGMSNKLAERIKDFLERLKRDHGSIDLEWLRYVPPEEVKNYLLSIEGMGLKCVECVRLLALKQLAFPVDSNVGRIVVRLGWVPLQTLHGKLQLHHLTRYPKEDSIYKYLWPRLSNFDLQTLYELHCQMITCGKVFCTKNQPNCQACPMRGDCKHFASSFASARCEGDIEDSFVKSHEKIAKIKVNDKESVESLQNCLDGTNLLLQKGKMSNDIAQVATSPTPRLKKMRRYRTEHLVYELPDTHHILEGLERREPDDPCPYLLAVWTPGEISNSVGLAECQTNRFDEKKPFCCNNVAEDTGRTVLGTILIPCRTALRGTFPLNGTYFQANEVVADDTTSKTPIDVPVASMQNLTMRTLYCGTTVSGIFRGLLTEEIQRCFKEGFICVRGFNHKTREPKPLTKRFHPQHSSKGDTKLSKEDTKLNKGDTKLSK